MLKMRAMLCFIWEMQVFKLDQNFVLASKCEHFGTPYFYHAISLRHFDTCCMKYSWKLINSPKISFSLFLYLEKRAFENGRKWPSPRHREGVANLKSSYFQKYKRYWAKIFSVKVNHAIQHYNTFWTNLKRVKDVWHGMTLPQFADCINAFMQTVALKAHSHHY